MVEISLLSMPYLSCMPGKFASPLTRVIRSLLINGRLKSRATLDCSIRVSMLVPKDCRHEWLETLALDFIAIYVKVFHYKYCYDHCKLFLETVDITIDIAREIFWQLWLIHACDGLIILLIVYLVWCFTYSSRISIASLSPPTGAGSAS